MKMWLSEFIDMMKLNLRIYKDTPPLITTFFNSNKRRRVANKPNIVPKTKFKNDIIFEPYFTFRYQNSI